MLRLPDVQGRQHDLADLRGKVVYLDFWASWCGPCRQSFPWMNQLQQRHAKDGLVVLAVNLDTEAKDAAAFLARYPASFSVLYDATGASAKAWGVKAMPSSYLIDRQGAIRSRHIGFRPSSAAELDAQIAALLQTP
ncbi:hypothetical protein GCM10007907_08220 [Chitinimonas prasina]|uniref:Thioredoxin domain-containing protein n=2 Tax=Chitinimonas prasina TaxID=1434937 RepID=A0ABQ5YAR0_9NEIS|nr:hypothetical protein GCM10007907_08220 [Chitinimonas prasina]